MAYCQPIAIGHIWLVAQSPVSVWYAFLLYYANLRKNDVKLSV
jgi:hypothetical protein